MILEFRNTTKFLIQTLNAVSVRNLSFLAVNDMWHDAVFKYLYSACVFTSCSVTTNGQCAVGIQSSMIGRCYEHNIAHTLPTNNMVQLSSQSTETKHWL